VATKDVGIAKDGSVKDTFTRGVELVGRQVTICCSGLSECDSTWRVLKFLKNGMNLESGLSSFVCLFCLLLFVDIFFAVLNFLMYYFHRRRCLQRAAEALVRNS